MARQIGWSTLNASWPARTLGTGLAALMLFVVTTDRVSAQDRSFRLGGFFEHDSFLYLEDGEPGRTDSRNQVTVQLEGTVELGPRATLFAALETRADASDSERNRLRLEEAYADLYLRNLDLRIGRQIIRWTRTDLVHTKDDLSPLDLTDLLDTEDERLGLEAVRVRYYLGDWTLEGVVAPSVRFSPLPDASSRWFPVFPTIVPLPEEPTVPVKATSRLLPTRRPPRRLESSTLALRVSTSYRGWDLAAHAFDGWNDLPSVRTLPRPTPTGLLELGFQPEVHPLRSVGVDLATTFGDLGLRAEVTWKEAVVPAGRRDLVDDRYLHVVVDVERAFDGVSPRDELSVLLEWSQQMPHGGPSWGETDLEHVFRRAFLTRLGYRLRNALELELVGVYRPGPGDAYLRPSVLYHLRDGLTLEVSYDHLAGPEGSFLGDFADNRRIQSRLKYSF